MISYYKPKQTEVKMETVEEYLARGGVIKEVNFKNAYRKYHQYGRDMKDKSTEISNTKMGDLHRERLDASIKIRKKFAENETA